MEAPTGVGSASHMVLQFLPFEEDVRTSAEIKFHRFSFEAHGLVKVLAWC